MHLDACTYVFMYACMYESTYAFVYVWYACMNVCLYACIHVSHTFICVGVFACAYSCAHVCIQVCMPHFDHAKLILGLVICFSVSKSCEARLSLFLADQRVIILGTACGMEWEGGSMRRKPFRARGDGSSVWRMCLASKCSGIPLQFGKFQINLRTKY